MCVCVCVCVCVRERERERERERLTKIENSSWQLKNSKCIVIIKVFGTTGIVPDLNIIYFLRFIYLFFREGKGGRKRGRETSMCGCLLWAPYWGPGSQPRHVP